MSNFMGRRPSDDITVVMFGQAEAPTWPHALQFGDNITNVLKKKRCTTTVMRNSHSAPAGEATLCRRPLAAAILPGSAFAAMHGSSRLPEQALSTAPSMARRMARQAD